MPCSVTFGVRAGVGRVPPASGLPLFPPGLAQLTRGALGPPRPSRPKPMPLPLFQILQAAEGGPYLGCQTPCQNHPWAPTALIRARGKVPSMDFLKDSPAAIVRQSCMVAASSQCPAGTEAVKLPLTQAGLLPSTAEELVPCASALVATKPSAPSHAMPGLFFPWI